MHGGQEHSRAKERADCYAFELVRDMPRVVDGLCRACPEAIVDFDITEGGRCVGLAFLAAGKYFLDQQRPLLPQLRYPVTFSPETWGNIFVYPGAGPRLDLPRAA